MDLGLNLSIFRQKTLPNASWRSYIASHFRDRGLIKCRYKEKIFLKTIKQLQYNTRL